MFLRVISESLDEWNSIKRINIHNLTISYLFVSYKINNPTTKYDHKTCASMRFYSMSPQMFIVHVSVLVNNEKNIGNFTIVW